MSEHFYTYIDPPNERHLERRDLRNATVYSPFQPKPTGPFVDPTSESTATS